MPAYEFRSARTGEEKLLRPLWAECFGDGEPFISCYEAEMFQADRVELALLDGKAVSMLTVLPVQLHTAVGESISGGCIYGVATRTVHRGKGVATRLLTAAMDRRMGHGCACMAVVPDTADLFRYYGRAMGARTAFYVREAVVTRRQLDVFLRAEPADVDPYTAIRRLALRRRDHLDWGPAAVAFQKAICRLEGGDLFCFPDAPGCCAAVQRTPEGAIRISELLAPEEQLGGCLAGLMGCMGSDMAEVRLPAWSGASLGGSVVPFGMLAGAEIAPEEQAYLGFDFA